MKSLFEKRSAPDLLLTFRKRSICNRPAAALLAFGLAVTGTAFAGGGSNPWSASATSTTPQQASGPNGATSFDMVRSPGIVKAGCLPNATAHVDVKSTGPVEEMTVTAHGLPPKTNFDFFVIQVPNAPFGLSWYQGDIESDAYGNASQKFVGRFNEETFIVAPGSANARVVHNNAFPDASSNPQTGPIHTYHLGMWFNSPKDATNAKCPDATTSFNGEHDAGVQVFNTSQFPDTEGPLFQLKP